MDQFKQQLGLPPDTPMVPDLGLMQPFLDVFKEIDVWQRKPDRKLETLPGSVGRIPELEDIVIDGRSLLGMYKGSKRIPRRTSSRPPCRRGVRIAMEYRLDLMNARAGLYDAWRQLRVTANALKGILNVTRDEPVHHSAHDDQPVCLRDQAKQFSLVLNAELPLIRVAERNNFRKAIIAYQRQRRLLQNQEDNVKFQLRQDIRSMQVSYINYEIAKKNLVLSIRLRDQAFEQILAPPQGAAGTGGLAQTANAATQTSNLIQLPEPVGRQRGPTDQYLGHLPVEPFDPVSRHRHLALR